MSKLENQIKDDFKKAFKGKDALTTSVLRMVMAEMKNAAIAKKAELTDEEILKVISRGVNQRKDSITSYQTGGRTELANKEQKEIKILQKYLPTQLAEAEIIKIVDETIKSTGAASATDFGKVMGAIMAKLKGQADGQLVNKIVKEKLTA